MKSPYYTPEMMIELLEKFDVLLSSAVTPDSTDPTDPNIKNEKENAYRDAMSFFFSGAFFD